ncbi:hypothetical protein [Gracilimonas sp.]|uniref:hypothetical protein n=1 Tax=Gracilimonas sp. TaxID=1974203 RepID=UPI0028714A3F|nr:hypothetical protein [Gracilimonas sp.]
MRQECFHWRPDLTGLHYENEPSERRKESRISNSQYGTSNDQVIHLDIEFWLLMIGYSFTTHTIYSGKHSPRTDFGKEFRSFYTVGFSTLKL